MMSLIEMFKTMRSNNNATVVSNKVPKVSYKFRDIPSLWELNDQEAEKVGRSISNIRKPLSMLDVMDL